MTKFNSIKISKGSGGFGGPLVITPTAEKNKVVYITGGQRPDIADKIAELTGCELVDGFKTSVPENEMACVIIDCGGTLRCGLYPQKEYQLSISCLQDKVVHWQNILQKISMYQV